MPFLNSLRYKPYKWLFTVILVGSIYLPLILNGGIITDDWGDIRQTWDCYGFFNCYKEWFPLFSNRPLAPLPLTLSTKLFAMHYSWYLIANSLIYFFALGFTSFALKPFLSTPNNQLFFFLAAVPCIALPLVASPINQLTATVAFLYWAISLNLLLRYCETKNFWTFVLSYVFLLCGFLTYEIILPLLLFTAFLPALLKPALIKYKLIYCYQFLLPIFLVLLIILLWQKLLAPQFMEVFSRLRFDPSQLPRNLYTWLSVFFFQLPSLFFKSINYISPFVVISFVAIAALFFLGSRESSESISRRIQLYFFFISTLSLLSCAFIFILSNESAVSWGYQARGLSSTWFAFAIFIASLLQLADNWPKILRNTTSIFVLLLTCFSYLSFSIQRDNYIESWQLQMHILKDVLVLIRQNVITPDTSIIGNVPRYVPNNYNRELVYSQSWDFPMALVLYAKNVVRGGIVIDSRHNDLQGLYIADDKAIVNDKGFVDLSNTWIYDYEPNTKKGTLTQIKNALDLQLLIEKWKRP